MKSTPAMVAIVFGFLCLGVVMFLVVGGRAGQTENGSEDRQSTSCLQLPEGENEAEQRRIGELGGQLEQLQVGASAKAEFESIARTSYQELSDCNTALTLLLRQSYCL